MIMTLLAIISWLAMICTVAGTGLTASESPKVRFWGFVLYVIDSVLWITYGIPCGQYALVTQNLFLIVLSLVGVRNNRKKKL
jgi:hypothetical protein